MTETPNRDEGVTMFVSCGNTEPHNHHVYEVDGDWSECAGIPTRSED